MLVQLGLMKKVSLVFRILVVVTVQFTLMDQETKCASMIMNSAKESRGLFQNPIM